MPDPRIAELADEYESAGPDARQAIIASVTPEDARPLADELRRRAAAAIAEGDELEGLARRRERSHLREVP